MKKIISVLLLTSSFVKAQKSYDGWILKNEGDTAKCKVFSPNGLPKRFKKINESYFYDYIIISTNTEKERRIIPDEIKEYYFEFSDSANKTSFHATTYKISHNKGFIIKRKDAGFYNVFVRKLVTKGYYHLFYYEQKDWIDGSTDKEFVLYKPTDSSLMFFSRTKTLIKILNWPAESERKNIRYKDWFKGKQNIVIDYNKFKEANKNTN